MLKAKWHWEGSNVQKIFSSECSKFWMSIMLKYKGAGTSEASGQTKEKL